MYIPRLISGFYNILYLQLHHVFLPRFSPFGDNIKIVILSDIFEHSHTPDSVLSTLCILFHLHLFTGPGVGGGVSVLQIPIPGLPRNEKKSLILNLCLSYSVHML